MHRVLIVLLCLSCPIFSLSVLKDEQLQRFNQDGYLILPQFIDAEDCDCLKTHVAELLEAFDPSDVSIFETLNQTQSADQYFLDSGDKIRFFFEKDAFYPDGSLKQSKEFSINKIGHAMHVLDPVFRQFSTSDSLVKLTEDIGIKNPLLIQSMYIFKQPRIGGEVTCHQDASFLYSEPNTTIGYWIAIEDATIENGCLWAIPGEHHLPLKKRFVRTEDGKTRMITFDETPWDLSKMVPLEVKKGTLIILHGHIPHMSYANYSSKSRHAFTLHVIDSSSSFPRDNWLRSEELPFKGFE